MSSPQPQPERNRTLTAALVCAASLIPSLVWIVRDRRVWPWDQAWYGEVSVDLWYLLTHAPGQWYQTMENAFGMKPPAIAWLGQFFVPLRHLFGSVEAALLFGILLTQMAVLMVIYRICAELAPASRGLGFGHLGFIGVAVAAGAQAFAGLSHQYFVEPLQCLAVAWTVLIAVRAHEWPRARIAIHLGASLLFGMLVKASTPLYELFPIVFILLSLARSQNAWDFGDEWRRWPSKALMYATVVSSAFGVVWYRRNYSAVVEHVRFSASGEGALNYGFRAPVAQKAIVWWRLLDQAFLEPYLGWVLGILALAAGAAILFARAPVARWRRGLPICLMSAAQIALVVYVFALNDNLEERLLYALLPYIAIIFVWLSSFVLSSASRYWVEVLVFVACAAQWTAVNRACFAPATVLANQFRWLNPIVTDTTAHRDLSEVVRQTSIFTGYNIVAVQEPWLNENSAAFFAAVNRLHTGIRSNYTSIGYAEKDPSAAMKRIDGFAAKFVITLEERHQPSPDFLNVVSLDVLHDLNNSQRFRETPFPNKTGIVIFERIP